MIGVCFWYMAGRTFSNALAAAMVSLRKWWGGRFSFFDDWSGISYSFFFLGGFFCFFLGGNGWNFVNLGEYGITSLIKPFC